MQAVFSRVIGMESAQAVQLVIGQLEGLSAHITQWETAGDEVTEGHVYEWYKCEFEPGQASALHLTPR